MVHVAAAFYICNAAQNGHNGTTSPSIQGLDINKGCICTPTAIDLSSFTATPGDGKVILDWSTEAEIDNVGSISCVHKKA